MLPFAAEAGAVTGSPTASLDLAAAPVTALTFSPDGTWLAAGDRAGAVCVWRRIEGGEFSPHSRWSANGIVCDLAITADNSRIACASYASTAAEEPQPGGWWVRDLKSGGINCEDESPCRAILFADDGQRILTGREQLEVWDPVQDNVRGLKTPSQWGIRSLTASNPSGARYVAVGYGDRNDSILRQRRGLLVPDPGISREPSC